MIRRYKPAQNAGPGSGKLACTLRFLAGLCLAYMDVGEGREQDAEALSRTRLRLFNSLLQLDNAAGEIEFDILVGLPCTVFGR
jgi:hypothetical protein